MGETNEAGTHLAPTEEGTTTAGSISAVLWLRTLGPSGLNPPQAEVIDRLRTLTEDDPMVDLDVDVWRPSLGNTRSDDRNPFDGRETLAEFERWADERECTLRPAFARHSAAPVNAEERRGGRIVTPLITLAVYNEGRLQAVYPHVESDEVRTIHDGVESLESMLRDAEQSTDERNESRALLIE